MISVNDPVQAADAVGPAPWVLEASQRPIAFAQVREDPAVDQWVADQLPANSKIIMVASGGCTAAALAAMPNVSCLHLVDPNPAQMALARLKLRLLPTAPPSERLSLLGHAPMATAERRLRLIKELGALQLSDDALGPIGLVAELGPDHAGRYEFLFAKLRESMSGSGGELKALLQLRDPVEQTRKAGATTDLGRILDSAFDSVMSLPNLVGLFGEGATRNRCEPFSRHFAGRTRHVLATQPAANNPYLWQMLQGHFSQETVYPWLITDSPERMPKVGWSIGAMADILGNFSDTFDFIHLSNILDWLSPEEASNTLELAFKALRVGGWTVIRQLNSSLDIQTLGGRFDWQEKAAASWHACDRSFFYKRLYLGQKK